MYKKQIPQNVGLISTEIYFPNTFVSQEDLETFNNVSKGKYTIGLGQTTMACLNDREDINSISLTCVNNLMRKNGIKPHQIGRLEVGTETLLDKSKSLKTVLMNLFLQSGNHDIEGVTSINACYGSTNALFNSINWVQSKSWDGRYAMVVSSDIAVYPKGSARPTGGAGAIAMLIGPDAPVVFDEVRSSFMDHTYDFYKPDPASEYPTVDGHQSIEIYLNALRQCFQTFKKKYEITHRVIPSLSTFSHFCFHTPFSKMVQKSFYALLLEDIKSNKGQYDPHLIKELGEFKFDSKAMKVMAKSFDRDWKNRCESSLKLAKMLGNIYTGSLYNGLLTILHEPSIDLSDKKVMLFSYGSGCASSMFFVHVRQGYKSHPLVLNSHFQQRLDSRVKISAEEYDAQMTHRESLFGKCGYEPSGSIDTLTPGTFYLTKVDQKFRRFYKIKSTDQVDSQLEKHFNWSGDLRPQKTSNNEEIVDDSEHYQQIIDKNAGLRRLDKIDAQFVKNEAS